MALALGRIGQIALTVSDVDRAEAFYGERVGLQKLFRIGDLLFYDCAGVRLLIEKSHDGRAPAADSTIYFRCDDIADMTRELTGRGVVFRQAPHLVAPMPDHDLWMAFFSDPDGNSLALMYEAPRGYKPRA